MGSRASTDVARHGRLVRDPGGVGESLGARGVGVRVRHFYGGFVALAPALVADSFGGLNVSGITGILYPSVAFGTLIGPSVASLASHSTQAGATVYPSSRVPRRTSSPPSSWYG